MREKFCTIPDLPSGVGDSRGSGNRRVEPRQSKGLVGHRSISSHKPNLADNRSIEIARLDERNGDGYRNCIGQFWDEASFFFSEDSEDVCGLRGPHAFSAVELPLGSARGARAARAFTHGADKFSPLRVDQVGVRGVCRKGGAPRDGDGNLRSLPILIRRRVGDPIARDGEEESIHLRRSLV